MAFGMDQMKKWLLLFSEKVKEQKEYLTELDRAIGGGDHGINMDRGCQAVIQKISAANYADLGELLKDVGMTFVATVGGASGPLYGTAFLKASAALKDKKEADLKELIQALSESLEGIKARGKAKAGDKTMIDVWEPLMEFLKKEEFKANDIVSLAKKCMEHTQQLEAKKGRAAYLGKRSIGHIDPGAASSYLLFASLAEIMDEGDLFL